MLRNKSANDRVQSKSRPVLMSGPHFEADCIHDASVVPQRFAGTRVFHKLYAHQRWRSI